MNPSNLRLHPGMPRSVVRMNVRPFLARPGLPQNTDDVGLPDQIKIAQGMLSMLNDTIDGAEDYPGGFLRLMATWDEMGDEWGDWLGGYRGPFKTAADRAQSRMNQTFTELLRWYALPYRQRHPHTLKTLRDATVAAMRGMFIEAGLEPPGPAPFRQRDVRPEPFRG